MAGENLKAFENLKENKNASLNSQEKVDLRNISLRDIQSQKEKIGNKTFLIGSESMKLRDIVSNLVFDETGNRAQIKTADNKLVTIGWGSELGAAIQVYAIANNKSIGGAGIDGKVGKDTVKGLQSTQNAVRAEKTREKQPENVDNNETLRADIGELVYGKVGPFLAKYKDAKYNLIKQQTAGLREVGKLVKMNDSMINGDKVTIKYISSIGKNAECSVVVDASKCKVGSQYSANKFGKAIEEAISKNEADLQKKENERIAKENMDRTNNIAKDGIESFNKNDITDLVVNKWVSLVGVSFKCDAFRNGRIQIRAVADGKNLKTFRYNNTDVLTDGSFDSAKFNNILKRECYSDALVAVKASINSTKSQIDHTSIMSTSSADSTVEKYGDLLDYINSFRSSDLNNEKISVEQAKKLAEMKKFCHEEFDKMDADIKTLNKTSGARKSGPEQKKFKDDIVKVIQKYAKLTSTGTGKYDYRYKLEGYKTVAYRDNFWKTGLSNAWRTRVNSMVKIADDNEIQIDR